MTPGTLMAREMAEQPRVLRALAARRDEIAGAVRAVVPRDLRGVHFAARGSSDQAAVFGRYLAELASGRPAGLVAPSVHTRYGAHGDYRGHVVVALSQSGETPEIVTVCERLRSAGAVTIAIVNDAATPLGLAADVAIAIDAGPERAVPATKTVTGQFLAAAVLATALGPLPFTPDDVAGAADAVAAVLDDEAPAAVVAARWLEADRLVVSGRGLLSAAAQEAALKLKETSGVLAEGLSSADLLHGPIGAVGADVPALVLDDGGPTTGDARELAGRLRDAGAPITVCAPTSAADLPIPAGLHWALAGIAAVVRAQQVARELTLALGRDPDAPPGLSKITATH
jgi:glucosamine--fructose-6-phosphate aminotransferase (isomerizing)